MASAQGFDLFPLGNIADGAGDHGAFGSLEGTQADLGGEDAAVLAAPDKIQARMDWPSAGRAIINVALGRMLPARFFRQQYFDWLAEKFLARVAEELLRLRVGQGDFAELVHDDHGVRRGLEKRPEFQLRFFPVGDVADGAGDQDAIRGFERAETDLDGKLASVLSPT